VEPMARQGLDEKVLIRRWQEKRGEIEPEDV
jgi:hypothetical protein